MLGKYKSVISLGKIFDDVTRQGEIEGLTFDKDRGQFLLLYNRGQKSLRGCQRAFMKDTAKKYTKCIFMILLGIS